MENGKRRITPYTLSVWNLAFGEGNIFRQLRSVRVPVFDNGREIVELPIFPVRFVDDNDGDTTKQSLIQRGKKYFAYSKGPSFLQYSGNGSKVKAKSVSFTRRLDRYRLIKYSTNELE